MPRLSNVLPRYRKHRASGQAVVTLSGQDFYLGPHGTKTSHLEYDRQVAEWLARGRRPLYADDGEAVEFTVVELAASYKKHARAYYRKGGKVTNEVRAIISAIKVACELYGREPANTFGPLRLQAVQQSMIRAGWSRKHINKQVGRIVRMFAWGVSQELVKPDVAHALREVPGLRKGRTEARDAAPVMPVDDKIVNATLPHLSPVVADMVRFQRLTGCRPEEVCNLRPCDVERSDDVWRYVPESHKTEHHGRQRIIFIGPKAQDILLPYLLRGDESYCFSPADTEKHLRDQRRSRRKTPLSCGNRVGSNRKTKPKRKPGEKYTTNSYRRAIHRACEIAFDMPSELRKRPKDETDEQRNERLARAAQWRDKYTWSPNRLRHSAGTEIRKRFGLEAAQVTLGHAAADITQLYAERDLEKAAEVMRRIG